MPACSMPAGACVLGCLHDCLPAVCVPSCLSASRPGRLPTCPITNLPSSCLPACLPVSAYVCTLYTYRNLRLCRYRCHCLCLLGPRLTCTCTGIIHTDTPTPTSVPGPIVPLCIPAPLLPHYTYTKPSTHKLPYTTLTLTPYLTFAPLSLALADPAIASYPILPHL